MFVRVRCKAWFFVVHSFIHHLHHCTCLCNLTEFWLLVYHSFIWAQEFMEVNINKYFFNVWVRCSQGVDGYYSDTAVRLFLPYSVTTLKVWNIKSFYIYLYYGLTVYVLSVNCLAKGAQKWCEDNKVEVLQWLRQSSDRNKIDIVVLAWKRAVLSWCMQAVGRKVEVCSVQVCKPEFTLSIQIHCCACSQRCIS